MTRLLLGALNDIGTVRRLDPPGWNALLLQARHQGVLAHLAEALEAAGLAGIAPGAAHRQLAAAQGRVRANHAALRFEIARVRRALCGHGFPVVVLKGGAYVAAGLPAARGRWATDLDILVPRARIATAEALLRAAGWHPKPTDDYDDHYYRAWMHELPPFRHPDGDLPLDVHHTIFPPVSGIRIAGEDLLARARPLGDGLGILAAEDLVLHAALHLFGEDTNNRLRDLLDLRALVHDLTTARPDGWEALLARAEAFGALWALDHAIEHLVRLLGVAVPDAVREAAAAGRRPWSPLMRRILTASLLGPVPDRPDARTRLAQGLAFMRSHWLRMPPLLLARHLWTKALRRRREAAAPHQR